MTKIKAESHPDRAVDCRFVTGETRLRVTHIQLARAGVTSRQCRVATRLRFKPPRFANQAPGLGAGGAAGMSAGVGGGGVTGAGVSGIGAAGVGVAGIGAAGAGAVGLGVLGAGLGGTGGAAAVGIGVAVGLGAVDGY